MEAASDWMPSCMSPSEAITKVWWSTMSPKRALSMRSASAMPTAVEMPWPSGPVVVSTPSVWPFSGWPGVLDSSWRNAFRSSIDTS